MRGWAPTFARAAACDETYAAEAQCSDHSNDVCPVMLGLL